MGSVLKKIKKPPKDVIRDGEGSELRKERGVSTSKTFEKSSAITWTYMYGSLSSIEVTVCKRDITAAVVEPVGRKACWSARPVESVRC